MTTREVLARLPSMFSVDDLRRVSQWGSSRVWVETRRWVQRGWATRLRRGTYSLHLMGRSYPLDLLEALHMVQPCALAYWTALSYHHLTEQLRPTVTIQTPKPGRTTTTSIRELPVRIVHIQPSHFWDIATVAAEDGTIAVTTPEKTVLDCLDRLDLCGGIVEVAKAIKAGAHILSPAAMARAARRYDSDVVRRRLLVLAQLLDWHASWLAARIPVASTAGYAWFDPTAPHKVLSRSTRLYINVATEDILNAE
jgi:predicted transcriptional regulator of viral defense system